MNKPDTSKLKELFDNKIIQVNEIGGIPLEVFDYQKAFGGKSWSIVETKYYERNCDAFTCMDFETLYHYLPGYLLTAINDRDSNSSEGLIFYFSSKSYFKLADLYNDEQLKFIYEALEYIAEEDDYLLAIKQYREKYGRV